VTPSQRVAAELDAVGVVEQPVEGGVGEGGLPEGVVLVSCTGDS
jgi:hypothetical protein